MGSSGSPAQRRSISSRMASMRRALWGWKKRLAWLNVAVT